MLLKFYNRLKIFRIQSDVTERSAALGLPKVPVANHLRNCCSNLASFLTNFGTALDTLQFICCEFLKHNKTNSLPSTA